MLKQSFRTTHPQGVGCIPDGADPRPVTVVLQSNNGDGSGKSEISQTSAKGNLSQR